MNKLGIFLSLIFIILVGLWGWIIIGSKQTPPVVLQEKRLNTQTVSEGEVSVEVTPMVLETGKEAKFRVTLNTHTVELDYDLLKVSNLQDDKGNNVKAISWSGGSGGHHLTGELIFPAISGRAKSVKLTITGISGSDRKFSWNIS